VWLYKDSSSAVTDVDETKGVVTGYLAHFGSLDSDGDIIHPGAFAKTIAESGPGKANRIKHLLNHNLGRPIGTFKELSEDATGLRYVSQLWKGTPDADLVLIGALHQNNFEHSIGYKEIPGKSQKKNDGNHLLELKLFEGSTLTFYGANLNTPIVDVKSEIDLEGVLQMLNKALRKGNLSDDTYKLLEQNRDAIDLALSSRTTEQPGNSTEQPEAVKGLSAEQIIAFTKGLNRQ
jgi:HK97 family phage prohead protease